MCIAKKIFLLLSGTWSAPDILAEIDRMCRKCVGGMGYDVFRVLDVSYI